MVNGVPDLRIRAVHQQDVNDQGDYVLYWMVASRRASWNFSLQRAVEWARDLTETACRPRGVALWLSLGK